MNKDKIPLVILLSILVLISVFRFSGVTGLGTLFLASLIGLMIFYIIQTVKAFQSDNICKLTIILQISISLMTFTLYTKYYHWSFGDYPNLFILPLFVFSFIYYMTIKRQKEMTIILTSSVFILLIIPMFGLVRHNAPAPFIPTYWYNRYGFNNSIVVKLPYNFKYQETEKLSVKGFELQKSKLFFDAIPVYRKALKIEPENPRLYFDLSQCYAHINYLEHAILLLDTAIKLDSNFAPFYGNRGLLYYKLIQIDKAIKDYKKALSIDSTSSSYYYNISLAFYSKHDYYNSCAMLNKAEDLGFKENFEMVEKIKSKCKR